MIHTLRTYGFWLIGLVAAIWFFVGYSSQDPRNIIQFEMSGDSVEQKASDLLSTLGFSPQNYESSISFYSNRRLLDSLQAELGRSNMIRQFREKDIANIEPFYWEIEFVDQSSGSDEIVIETDDEGEGPPAADEDNRTIRLRYDTAGNFLELINEENQLPGQLINRNALAASFGEDADNAKAILDELSDSLLVRLFVIDLQNRSTDPAANRNLERLQAAFEQGGTYDMRLQDLYEIAEYHLEQSDWNISELQRDTLEIGRSNSVTTITSTFSSRESKLGQELYLRVKTTSTGSLLSQVSSYNPGGSDDNGFGEVWSLISNLLIFLFGLCVVIIFFFRLRARAIDTNSALVVAIITGLAVSLQILLGSISDQQLFAGSGQWFRTVLILVGMGMGGAMSSLAFFVLFATGDSITRQYWPAKLSMYDYLRQGMIFNKPIGSVLIRSVTLAFILAGSWTVFLWLFPNLYFNIQDVFISEEAAWAPLHMVLENFWFSLSIVLGIFMVVGSQTYAQTSRKVIAALVMILACGVVVPISQEMGPALQEFGISLLIGLVLTFVFIQWDFLTVLLSHFLFIGLLGSAGGWIVESSPDSHVFVLFMAFMVLLFVGGLWAVFKGKEEQVLPRYVPRYVDELAQEERIKQELQIARDVQRSFLPASTPKIEHLDITAICRPAYETGGDYYDFIPIDDNRIAVAVGDVSGKGIQAAFYMTFVKGILHSLCREIESPAELLKKANRLFFDNAPRGTFISLIYGIIDLKEKSFHFARAGHNPIVKINSSDGEVEELQPGGIGIGLTRGQTFDQNIEEVNLPLKNDDILILYTDGIVEALNSSHVFYGSERLIHHLRKNKDKSATELLDELSNDVISFIGEAKQHDDMTMMIIKLDSRK